MTVTAASLEPLVPSLNFSMVCPGVYRSGYPTKKNYSFLCALRLRSILYLCPEDYAESNLKFCEEHGIHVLRFPTEGNKEPFNDIAEPLMHRILSAIADTRNLPLLIHCNKGKHRTGTVVACLRHLQGWSLVSIFEEYKRFAGDKARIGDQQYTELYHPIVKLTPPYVAPWLTITPRLTTVFSERELLEAEAVQLGTSLLAAASEKPSKKSKQGPPLPTLNFSPGVSTTATTATATATTTAAAPSASTAPSTPTPVANSSTTNLQRSSSATVVAAGAGGKVSPCRPIEAGPIPPAEVSMTLPPSAMAELLSSTTPPPPPSSSPRDSKPTPSGQLAKRPPTAGKTLTEASRSTATASSTTGTTAPKKKGADADNLTSGKSKSKK